MNLFSVTDMLVALGSGILLGGGIVTFILPLIIK